MFRFPRSKFVDVNARDLQEQLCHIQSEVTECHEALHHPDPDVLAVELMDVVHSAETALRILQEVYGVTMRELQSDVIRKNMARGYYV